MNNFKEFIDVSKLRQTVSDVVTEFDADRVSEAETVETTTEKTVETKRKFKLPKIKSWVKIGIAAATAAAATTAAIILLKKKNETGGSEAAASE